MTTKRIEKSTEYLRYTFTPAERLQMGDELAAAHNRMTEIEEEEAVVKAQFKDRKTQVEQTVGKLSRDLSNGFTMQNISCKLVYDSPNPNEVSYIREDNGEVAKTRFMTESERQQEIDFETPAAAPVEQSALAITEFFGSQDATATDQSQPIEGIPFPVDAPEVTPFDNPDPAAAAEAIKPEHDAEWDALAPPVESAVVEPIDTPAKGKPGRKERDDR